MRTGPVTRRVKRGMTMALMTTKTTKTTTTMTTTTK
jgi:hypothetical protein